MIGQRFGKLEVVERVIPAKPSKYVRYRCRCECGGETVVYSHHLKSGATQSCGNCRGAKGHSRTPTYKSWESMRRRCTDETHHGHKNYAGRGLRYDPRWERFDNFLADMGERPPGATLDRIDYNAGYSKENCRWATIYTQNNNKRQASRTRGLRYRAYIADKEKG